MDFGCKNYLASRRNPFPSFLLALGDRILHWFMQRMMLTYWVGLSSQNVSSSFGSISAVETRRHLCHLKVSTYVGSDHLSHAFQARGTISSSLGPETVSGFLGPDEEHSHLQ